VEELANQKIEMAQHIPEEKEEKVTAA